MLKTFLFSHALLLCICFVCITRQAAAQGPGQNKNKFVRKLQRGVWTIGFRGIVIDDDGRPFKDLLDAGKSWNLLLFPTCVSFEGLVREGWSIEGVFSYSRYKAGVIVNNEVMPSGGTFLAFDANVKYKLGASRKAFDPYAIGGLGYTFRSVLTDGRYCPTFNIGLGVNIWFYKGLAINIQSMAKFKMMASSSNYLMHFLGIVYRFNLLTGARSQTRSKHRY